MTYTEEAKQELIHLDSRWDCCRRAEICAAILLSGGLSFRGAGRYGLSVNLKSLSASRYYFSLIKKYLGVTPLVSTLSTNRLGEQSGVELRFSDEDVDESMEKLMLRDENALFGVASAPNPEIVKNPCCKAAFLKSAFLITGYVSNPEKEYALSISASSEEAAKCIRDICLSEGVNARISTNRSRYVVYTKSAEGVSTILSLMGAQGARLRLENVRIMKDIKNGTNRQTNCDNNNIERTIKSASTQMEDIRYIASALKSERIPDWAREIMSLRLENPDSSLQELGEMCDPPLTKSGVNNRLRRLSRLADSLREQNKAPKA